MDALTDLIYLTLFALFAILQGLFINGVHESFKGGCVNELDKGRVCNGNILYKINPEFFEKHKNDYWAKPFYTCVRCMSSVYGAITFWPAVLFGYGFHAGEIPLFVFDVFILSYLNYFFYKKV